MKKSFFSTGFLIRTVLFLCSLISAQEAFTQILLNPLTKDKSHEELNVSSIIINDTATIISIEVKNKPDSTRFCVGPNIYIREAKNDFKRIPFAENQGNLELGKPLLKEFKLLKTEGSPTCPEKQFKGAGESFEFKLMFSKLHPLPEFIDLVDEDKSSSFKFEGICLKDSLAYEVSTYHQAFIDFESGKTDTALLLFKKIVDFHDTVNNMYENAFFNIPRVYESLGDKGNAIIWYKKLLQSEIRDNDWLENDRSSFTNFKHRSSIRLAALCKNMGKLEESLSYLWLADTLYTFNDTSKVLRAEKNALLLMDKLKMYVALKKYDEALFFGIKQIINEEIPNLYDAHATMLVDIIKQNYDYKKYIAAFDKALLKLTVFDGEEQVTGKFKFKEKEYQLKISKDYTILAIDPKTKQLRKAVVQDKDQTFFIERVKISDFYLKLKK